MLLLLLLMLHENMSGLIWYLSNMHHVTYNKQQSQQMPKACMLHKGQRLTVLLVLRTCWVVGAVGFSPQVPQSEFSLITD